MELHRIGGKGREIPDGVQRAAPMLLDLSVAFVCAKVTAFGGI